MMDEVEALFRTGVALHRDGDLGGAIETYRRVLRQVPGLVVARDNLCLALLAAGDYAEGFSLYDVRFERSSNRVPHPSLSFPEWRGEPLAGRSILVWMEQGFGDQVMFARFARVLADQGARVSIITPKPLVRLFDRLGVGVIAVAGGPTEIPAHDFWIMPASLPGRLGVTVESLPSAPYLAAGAGHDGVGVAWRGRATPDPKRSMPEPLGQQLRARLGAVSLQPEDSGAVDFEDTARIIERLGLVVTIDTAVAHLAGAMGKPTWVLLPFVADWRWMQGRDDSPWYPSMRLFRQPAPDDWESVIEAVEAAARAR